MITSQSDAELEIQFNNVRIEMQTIIWIILLGIFGLVMGFFVASGRVLMLTLGLLFTGAGVFVLAKEYSQRSILRRNGTATITQTRVIGGRSKAQEYEKADITGVFYSTSYKTTQKAAYRDGSDVYLVLKDQTRVLIDRRSAFPTTKLLPGRADAVEPLEDEAQQIAAFLSVPLQVRDLSVINPSSYL